MKEAKKAEDSEGSIRAGAGVGAGACGRRDATSWPNGNGVATDVGALQ
jgi:hypothetical protein